MISDLKQELNTIMNDFDNNIKNKEDLDYIKSQVYKISNLFLDEMDKLADINLKRLNVLNEREKELAKKVANVEKKMDAFEKELFMDQEEDGCAFEITCPYCNEDIFVDEFTNGEITCPECNNVIELDWHEDECDCCDCDDGCDGECSCDNCDCEEDDM